MNDFKKLWHYLLNKHTQDFSCVKNNVIMKKIMLGIFMSISLISYSQINFENSYLKDFLLTKNSDLMSGYHIPEVIDTNNDNEIDSSEAKNIIDISIKGFNPTHNLF